jgi:4'-phosphopantetheinyl transferase
LPDVTSARRDRHAETSISSEKILDILYPVILHIPREILPDRPVERNAVLSRWARRALQKSALRSGAGEKLFGKDDRGVPVPADGWHWSVTHKPAYVGGLVANRPVGIDLEEVRTCSESLIRKMATPTEWQLLSDADRDLRFIRIWTAKEAVVKAEGIGIRGLNDCRVVSASADRLLVRGSQETWTVEHFFLNRHVAAVARGSQEISWTVKAPPLVL